MRNGTRILTSLTVGLLLALQPLLAQVSDAVRARVRELHASGSEVRISISDGTSVRGRIVRVDAESVVLRQASAQERVIRFANIVNVRKQGGGLRKSIWIPLVIGGAVALTFCAAPYPIGFLCRSDPS